MSLIGRLADRVLGERIADAELPHPVPRGVIVRRNRLVPAVGGWFMGGSRTPAAAVTMGRTILVAEDCAITDELIVHELVHVEQWRDPLFALKYVAGWARHGYRANPYEQDAYDRQKAFAATKKSAPPRRL